MGEVSRQQWGLNHQQYLIVLMGGRGASVEAPCDHGAVSITANWSGWGLRSAAQP